MPPENMNGTKFYECIAVIFITKAYSMVFRETSGKDFRKNDDLIAEMLFYR
jgi:hypothetical protein